jgi:hypothetical protein
MESSWYTAGTMTPSRYYLPGVPFTALRDGALPVAAAVFAIILPFHILVHAFILLGQAHFFLTYLYQWRGKRMNRTYLVAAALLLAGFTLYFALSGEALPLMVLITVLFSFHFAWDEVTLHDEQMTPGRIIAVAGFTLSFFLISLLFLFPEMVWVSIAAACVGIGAILVRFAVEHRPASRGEVYLWFVQALLFAVATWFQLPGHVLAVIVIIHVLNWYIAYGVRLAPHPERARKYWREVFLSIAIVGALFYAHWELNQEALAVLFGLAPYYAWATAHIVLSVVASRARRKG